MRAKDKRLILYFIVAGIGFGLLFGGVSYYNSSQIQTLSWSFEDLQLDSLVKNPEIKCSIYQQLNVVDEKGNLVNSVNSAKFSDSPTLAVTAVTSGNIISGTISTFYFNCVGNSAGGDIVVDPSSVSVVVKGQKTLGGSMQNLLVKSITTNEVTILKGSSTAKSIGFISFYGRDIENAIAPTNKFKSNLSFGVSGNIKIHYKAYPSVKYTFPVTQSAIQTLYSFNVGDIVSSGTITQKNVDYDKDGIIDSYDLCPTVAETFNNYKDTDGCPDTVSSTPTGGTQEPPVDKNTCPSGQIWVTDHCESSTKPTTSSELEGLLKIKYKVLLADRVIQNNIDQTGGAKVSFSPLSFVSFKGERFVQLIFEPILTLTKGSSSDYSSTIGNISYKGTLIDQTNGKEYPISGFGTSVGNRITKDSDGYYHFQPLSLTSDMIQNAIRNNPSIPQNQKLDFKATVILNGDFDLTRQIDNKKFKAVLSNFGFEYPVSYDPTVESSTQEPCQGLSGQDLINCKTANPCNEQNNGLGFEGDCAPPSSGGGGYCEGLTSQQCIDKGGSGPSPTNSKVTTNSNDQPNSTTGIFNICDGTSTISDCVTQAVNKGTQTTNSVFSLPQLDQNLIIMGLIGFLLFIVVIMVIKKRKKIA